MKPIKNIIEVRKHKVQLNGRFSVDGEFPDFGIASRWKDLIGAMGVDTNFQWLGSIPLISAYEATIGDKTYHHCFIGDIDGELITYELRTRQENHPWHIFGKYYGYPDCCVDAFIRGDHHEHNLVSSFPLHGTGFVPCLECAKKTEAELLEIVAKNRFCPTPFPEDNEHWIHRWEFIVYEYDFPAGLTDTRRQVMDRVILKRKELIKNGLS